MAFETLSERQRLVATKSLALCRTRWGGNGLKREEQIDAAISWRPTFFVKPARALIVAVEVGDVLFPEPLKGAAHDIERYDFPISVYQACSLDIYQADPRLARANLLRDHGFGLITVDDSGIARIQLTAEPLAQHISSDRFDAEVASLTPRIKVKFRDAYTTYQTNVGQGLQEAGQIIEALILCISAQAETAGMVTAGTSGKATAAIIDELYTTGHFHNHRAHLGGARSFVRTYRNVCSHPAVIPRQAAEKIRKCKAGFFEALRIATELRAVIRDLGFRVTVV